MLILTPNPSWSTAREQPGTSCGDREHVPPRPVTPYKGNMRCEIRAICVARTNRTVLTSGPSQRETREHWSDTDHPCIKRSVADSRHRRGPPGTANRHHRAVLTSGQSSASTAVMSAVDACERSCVCVAASAAARKDEVTMADAKQSGSRAWRACRLSVASAISGALT